ncbi:hypothetical protein PoB_001004300 [Plakobranchus ocellatus]|uniref:Uncharacterized protein n=1 Tax=Plakobranchus ocellatus TaxID=259542 RepID=A0AAV3YLW9_9GAST|nr:hypothetical protein PoB_001004300 [Plakobranchus ocellatus]
MPVHVDRTVLRCLSCPVNIMDDRRWRVFTYDYATKPWSICGAPAGENAPEVYRDPVSRNRTQAQHKRPRLRRQDGDLKARGRIAMDGLHTRKPYNQSPVAW